MEIPIGKTILVVEDASERIKWFQEALAGNRVFFRKHTIGAIYLLMHPKIKFDMVLLDFDLGPKKTALDVADWLKRHKYTGEIIIHSMNPVGSSQLKGILPSAVRLPYSILRKIWKGQND